VSQNEKVIAGLSCARVLEMLSDYLDGELAALDRARLEEHLRACEGCTRFASELRATVRALRASLRENPSLPTGLAERLRRALEEDEAGR
jgi:anti-sigma factor (TIGR02949 family)